MKRLDTSKITTNLKNLYYVVEEMQDTMKEFYQKKRNLKILSIFSKIRIDTELKISVYTIISTSYPMKYHTLL